MKRIIYLLLATMMVAGCKDDITLDDSNATLKFVVYCFPTTADSTMIHVSRSIPVKANNYSTSVEDVDYATITYTVNGEQYPVTSLGNGLYKAVGRQKCGDRIAIRVTAPDIPEAKAETMIPKVIEGSSTTVKDVRLYVASDEEQKNFTQYSMTFTDPKGEKNYYATRVGMKAIEEEEYYWMPASYLIDNTFYPELNTQSEPLLKPSTSVDDLFGITNSFYGGLYIFDDGTIDGTNYTLHLNVGEYTVSKWDKKRQGLIELLHLSPEFYRFLNSLNAQDNDVFSETGLSQTMPTATNVRGGLGIVGGYSMSIKNK